MTYDEFNNLLDDAAHAVLDMALARDKGRALTTEQQFDALVLLGDALQQPLRTVVGVSDEGDAL